LAQARDRQADQAAQSAPVMVTAMVTAWEMGQAERDHAVAVGMVP